MGSCASDAFARADLRPAIRGFYRRLVEGTFHLRHITLASRHQKLLSLSDGGYNPTLCPEELEMAAVVAPIR